MIRVTINGRPYRANSDQTILQVCREHDIYIPTLCHHVDLPPCGKCGLCVVKIDGENYVYACMQLVKQGIIIETKTPDVLAKSRESLKAFLNVNQPPPSEEIEDICKHLNPKNPIRQREYERSYSLTFDPTDCINCGRCIRICSDVLNVGALNDPNSKMRTNECISCGSCITVCPTHALTETPSSGAVLKAIVQGKVVVLQLAPAVRVSIAEVFGCPVGTICTGKIITAAKMMGFSYVFDTNFGADVTIVEEGSELIHRLTTKGSVLPMFTSCCPGWINFVERSHSEMIPHISSTKSPHMITGKLIKTYFAERMHIKESNLYVVSLMPCVAKKGEVKRMQMLGDVDAVITAREFAQMVKDFGIEWSTLKDSDFDKLMGESTGAASLFGVTGGVTEAAVRYAYEKLTGKKLENVVFSQFRGNTAIKQATIKINNMDLNIAVCNGIASARQLIESEKYKQFQFIEVMACPGGCIIGGGQPKLQNRELAFVRAKSLYKIDQDKQRKVSHDNLEVMQLYKLFLGEPYSHKPHMLLHTHYEPQETATLAYMKRMQTQPIVAFGSATGTATRLARLIAGFIKTTSCAINNLNTAALIRRRIACFVISTTGDGEFPTNAKHFIEELRDSDVDLSEVKYAVCGLGSKMYTQFCLAGKQLDLIMEQHKAVKLVPFCSIDTSTEDGGELLFEKWCFNVAASLGIPPPRIGVHLMYKLTPDNDTYVIDNPLRPLTFEKMTIKSRQLTTEPNSSEEIYKYQIKLPSGLFYHPCCHVQILPANSKEVVQKTIEVMKYDPKQSYLVSVDSNAIVNYVPERVTIEQLFTNYIDLNGPPNRSLLRCFLKSANDEGGEKIQKLLDINNQEALKEYIKDKNIADFIVAFSQYGVPPIDSFVSSCPHIKPRTYSIASAPCKTRQFMTLYATTTTFGNSKTGLCSGFLKNKDTSKIYMKLIEDEIDQISDIKDMPMLVISTEIGIASVFSLLELRQYDDGPFGKCQLYHSRKYHNKLIDELIEFKANGAVDDVFVGYTEEKNHEPQTVLDLMRNNMDNLWKLWENPKCMLYYNGLPGQIADEIIQLLVDITESFMNVTLDEAHDIVSKHNIIFNFVE